MIGPVSKSWVWRQIRQLRAKDLDLRQKRLVRQLAEKLAGVAGEPKLWRRIYYRIMPRSGYDLSLLQETYQLLRDHSVEELREPGLFARIFLGFKATSYQLKVLEDNSRQIAVLGCRQSGKTVSIGAKILHFLMTKPGSRGIIVAPSFRQSKKTFRKMKEHLQRMPPIVKKAWIIDELKTILRFVNGSEVEAYPYTLERLRGETADIIYVDEADFIPEDEELFEGTLKPVMATRWERGAQVLASSTPWRPGTYFYRIWHEDKLKRFWSHQFWTWREAVAEGIIPKNFIDYELQTKDANYFQREYECRWTIDTDSWLTMDLINCCLDPDLDFWNFEDKHTDAELYAGLDLGKKVDYSVLTVLERKAEHLYVRLVKVWPLETAYSSIVGYIKVLSERWKTIFRICVDITGQEAAAEMFERAGIPGYEGVKFTQGIKESMATLLKQEMQKGLEKDAAGKWAGTSMFHIPYPEDKKLVREIVAQLNAEKFEHTPQGRIRFYHPENTHDDIFWSMALACWAARREASSTGGIEALAT